MNKKIFNVLIVFMLIVFPVLNVLNVSAQELFSEKLRKHIKHNEGLSLIVYSDPSKRISSEEIQIIGYGHNITTINHGIADCVLNQFLNSKSSKEAILKNIGDRHIQKLIRSLIMKYGINVCAAECILENDIELAQEYLIFQFGNFDEFTSNQKIALIDMMHCMGPNTFSTFRRMIREIRNRNWNKATIEIKQSLWYKVYTSRAKRNIRLIQNDPERMERCLSILFDNFDEFTINQKASLIALMQSMGFSTFKTFKKMIFAININDWDKAVNEIKDSRWYKVHTKCAEKSIDLIINDHERIITDPYLIFKSINERRSIYTKGILHE